MPLAPTTLSDENDSTHPDAPDALTPSGVPTMSKHRVAHSHCVSLEVRAFYSVPALARIGNVSANRLRRLLRANGVTFISAGRALFVPLTEIQRKIPRSGIASAWPPRRARAASSSPRCDVEAPIESSTASTSRPPTRTAGGEVVHRVRPVRCGSGRTRFP